MTVLPAITHFHRAEVAFPVPNLGLSNTEHYLQVQNVKVLLRLRFMFTSGLQGNTGDKSEAEESIKYSRLWNGPKRVFEKLGGSKEGSGRLQG